MSLISERKEFHSIRNRGRQKNSLLLAISNISQNRIEALIQDFQAKYKIQITKIQKSNIISLLPSFHHSVTHFTLFFILSRTQNTLSSISPSPHGFSEFTLQHTFYIHHGFFLSYLKPCSCPIRMEVGIYTEGLVETVSMLKSSTDCFIGQRFGPWDCMLLCCGSHNRSAFHCNSVVCHNTTAQKEGCSEYDAVIT